MNVIYFDLTINQLKSLLEAVYKKAAYYSADEEDLPELEAIFDVALESLTCSVPGRIFVSNCSLNLFKSSMDEKRAKEIFLGQQSFLGKDEIDVLLRLNISDSLKIYFLRALQLLKESPAEPIEEEAFTQILYTNGETKEAITFRKLHDGQPERQEEKEYWQCFSCD